MQLEPGTTLGHYEIVSSLGAGGMGEVYRAKDMKLGREVALKLLLEEVSDDPERLARFQREAKVLASLNHNHIATLYGFEQDGDTSFLVMELVEGETLAARIKRGAIPVDEVLPLFLQIAEGLEAAHEKAVIHRDLKPANIIVSSDGQVKILDFGLAKAMAVEVAESGDASLSMSPTLTLAATQRGEILGTAAYMSPEQAQGEQVDKRTDIWAFGACLFEALTSHRLFDGDKATMVLASVLKDEPDFDLLPADTPLSLVRLLRRCLKKEARDRLHDIADARLELRDAAIEPVPSRVADGEAAVPRRASLPLTLAALAVGAGIVAIAVLALLQFSGRDGAQAEPVRFLVRAPGDGLFRSAGEAAAPAAVSPDGSQVVFGLIEPDGSNRLWLRSLDSVEARPLPGTEFGTRPFWSPDSRSIGFFANRKLMKLELAGGVALPICDAAVGTRGGTWGPDDVIVFSPSPAAGLQRVSAEGGSPEPVTMIDRSAGEASHRYPYFLPDGRTVVFLVLSVAATESVGTEAENRVDAVRLDTGERRNLLVGAANAEFAGGELLFYRGGSLLARRLDLDSLELTGETRVLVEGLKYDANYERAIFSTSERTLVYEKGTFRGASQLTWIDRQGETVGSLGEGRFYPSISPGGRRAAFVVSSGDGQQSYLMADLELDVERPVISNQTIVGDAIWSPDGSRFAYAAVSDTSADVFVASVEEGSTERLFDAPDVSWYPRDWSPDGRFLLLQREIAEGIWTYDFESPSEPSILLTAQGSGILFPKLSPDGRWLAYSTNEGGNWEVWTTSFPPGERRWRVSQGGGLEPTWAADGRSLYYRTMGNRFLEAEIVAAGESLRIGQSTLLFDALLGSDIDAPMYDVTPDGEHFLVNTMSEEEARIPLTVAFNWKSGL